jgi:hypothetical protein
MSVKYNCNHDLQPHITAAAATAGIPYEALGVNYFRDKVTRELTTGEDRTGSVFTIGDGETDTIVMIHMQFDNYFLPDDVFNANLVHRKIFRNTVRHLFKKMLTPPLQKFLVALYDDLYALGWEVAVYTKTPNGIPAVQWRHAESKVGMLPIPNTRKELAETIAAAKAGKLDGDYDEVIAQARSKI